MHTPKNIATALLLAIALCAGCTSNAYKTIEPQEFEQLIASTDSLQLLDVRTPAEYAEGHLMGAMLIDIKSGEFAVQATEKLRLNHPVAVYCRSGKRSAMAADTLTALGFKVMNLNGGITAWQEQGFTVAIE